MRQKVGDGRRSKQVSLSLSFSRCSLTSFTFGASMCVRVCALIVYIIVRFVCTAMYTSSWS